MADKMLLSSEIHKICGIISAAKGFGNHVVPFGVALNYPFAGITNYAKIDL